MSKILPISEAKKVSSELRASGKKVVHCHGVFDLLHVGHFKHLASARAFGDKLFVSITADKFVKKGPGRPVFNETLRAEALAALEAVDHVLIVEDTSAIPAIEAVCPTYFVKGPDYSERGTTKGGNLDRELSAVSAVGGEVKFTDDITFSSSELINRHFQTQPESTALYLRDLSKRYTMETISEYFEKASKLKVLVFGDTIIDEYHYTYPMGRSSKESLVAHKYMAEERFAGGVLATANHVSQLVEKVKLVTLIGDEISNEDFLAQTLNSAIFTKLFIRKNCNTTIKRRYVVQGEGKKVFEVCFLDDKPLDEREESPVLNYLEEIIDGFDLVVVNDFGHGLITSSIRDFLTKRSKKLCLNVQANSANYGFNLINNYSRADFVCIDEAEMRLATREKFSEPKALVERLHNELKTEKMMVTRGSSGCLCLDSSGVMVEAPALATSGIDKIGAGDAFFAYTSPCFAAGMPSELLALLGNAVGALKLQIVGNRSPVSLRDCEKFLTRLLKH